MAASIGTTFTLAADADTVKAFRLVCLQTPGDAVLPDATDDDEVLAVVGATAGQVTDAGDVAVRGFDGGVHKICVAASQTVAVGDPLYMTGTVGAVQTDTDGWLVGVAKTGGTSGASELAVIEAVLWPPRAVVAES